MPIIVQTSLQDQSRPGASIDPIYVHREMKAYAVTENEISTLSLYNSAKTILFSAGTFFVSAGLSIYLGAAFAGPPIPEDAKVLSHWGVPFCGAIALIFYVLGFLVLLSGRSAWETIKRESKAVSEA